MVRLNNRMMAQREIETSESEEMYLLYIALENERDSLAPVPLALLANRLGVTPISANQMVKKLVGRDLVRYLPYEGVHLTSKGAATAARVLRIRRLWKRFLEEVLEVDATIAESAACDFEHVTPLSVAARLADALDRWESQDSGNHGS